MNELHVTCGDFTF